MAHLNSVAIGKSSGAGEAEQTSTVLKGANSRQGTNIQRVENAVLIWLDKNIDNNNKDCSNTVTQLRRVVNDINTYTDVDQCVEFISTITNNKVYMIISGTLGQHIVPCVHNMSQVDSIFIFCGNKEWHEQWAKEWPKIKGVFTEISPICEALKQAAQQYEHNAISMSFVTTNTGDASNETLDRLDPSFMYTQILKEILLTIKFEEKHIQEFIDYCREQFADNNQELNNIQKLETEYRTQTPIWWYTYHCFMHPMLNLGLRLMNVDLIIRMGFFLGDLHRHIKKLHSEQFGGHHTGEKFTVYRGQGLSDKHFKQMTKTKGGLISFNNFLSTSKTRDISLEFARKAAKNPDLVGILFIMKIDPVQSTSPFASIRDVSDFPEEDEVLFAMHTVFRIKDIKPIGENNRLFEVNLTLTGDNDQDLRVLTNRIREETFPDSEGWYRLGEVLMKMGQSDKAQEVYEVLLDQRTTESEKGPIYHQLGRVKDNRGEYQEAIACYEKAIDIYKKTLSPNHLNFANSYNWLGNAYYSLGNYTKALSSHEKALAIRQESLPPNDPDLAASYNNIGLVYDIMGDYPKALLSHEKALAIRQQSLPPNHPDLALSYNNVGLVYYNMGDYVKALSSHEKALAIRQQSLPPNHPDLAKSYNNIGNVYGRMGDYPKVLSSYEKALAIRQQSLPPNHPDFAASYNNIGLVYDSMGGYPKALSSHEKALAIRQQSLPPNHPDLAMSYGNIGSVYNNMGNYSKARSCYEHAVDIGQHSLPTNHPHLQLYRKNLELVQYTL
jgi:tetratricopeptide (TPR) repeat protein